MSRLKKLRILSQAVFIFLFFFLLIRTEYHGRDAIAYPVKIFLDIDPLILITTFLSAHTIVLSLLWSLALAALTLVLGRVFCGWICPLGTLNDFVSFIGGIGYRSSSRLDIIGIKTKYYLLIAVLTASLFQINFAGLLDPIALMIRSFAVAISPGLNYIVHALFDGLYGNQWLPANAISERFYDFLKLHIISFDTPVFRQGAFVAIIFMMVLGLNSIRKRFWCRFACPLGALLALISRFSVLNHKIDLNSCSECGSCTASCPTGARPDPELPWNGSECVLCMNCESSCSDHSIGFEFGRPVPHMRRTDLKRRYILEAGAAGIGSLALFRLAPVRATGSAGLVRPPGAVSEEQFLRKCVKCGECMKVCITNGLQPSFLQAGFEGIWSPVFDFRTGYCEFNCTLCGQVCPTQAIEKLPVADKQKRKIGLAFIDINRCLPYAFNTNCIVCEEHCPTSPKAITFKKEIISTAGGGKMEIKKPVVDPEVCTGCGICQYKCPVGGKAAVRVSSTNEDRSRANQLILRH